MYLKRLEARLEGWARLCRKDIMTSEEYIEYTQKTAAEYVAALKWKEAWDAQMWDAQIA